MERLDDILGYSNLKIYQDDRFFSFSLDSIILANYCTIRGRDKNIVEFCSGNGVVSMVLSRRTKNIIEAVEIQEDLHNLASKSVVYNGLDDQIKLINDDVKKFAQVNLNKYDLVVCNPPYFKVNECSKINEVYQKMIARHEVMLNLEEVCSCAKKVLKDNGTFSMVHRCDRLMDIIYEFRKNNIEPKRLKFIFEREDKNANLVLIEGQKNGKVGLIVDRPLILYNDDGSFTFEYDLIQKEVKE